MRIAITGGTGFLGRRLSERLGRENDLVILSRQNKEGLVQTDYTYENLVEVLNGVDAIIHLAATRSGKNDISEFFNDIQISQNLYQAANENGIKNIVFASSISVFSNPNTLPWTEKQAVEPVTMYGIAKHTIEMLGLHYNRNKNMNIKNLRFAHLFGPNEKNNYMINLFFRLAYNKEKLSLNTSSSAEREFLYVEDAVSAIVAAINAQDKKGTFHIGSGINLTNEEVAKSINEIFDNEGNLEVLDPDAPDASKPSYMDSSLAKRELEFIAEYDFEKALREIYKKMEEVGDVPIRY